MALEGSPVASGTAFDHELARCRASGLHLVTVSLLAHPPKEGYAPPPTRAQGRAAASLERPAASSRPPPAPPAVAATPVAASAATVPSPPSVQSPAGRLLSPGASLDEETMLQLALAESLGQAPPPHAGAVSPGATAAVAAVASSLSSSASFASRGTAAASSSSTGAAAAAASSSRVCPLCTFANAPDARLCDVCGGTFPDAPTTATTGGGGGRPAAFSSGSAGPLSAGQVQLKAKLSPACALAIKNRRSGGRPEPIKEVELVAPAGTVGDRFCRLAVQVHAGALKNK